MTKKEFTIKINVIILRKNKNVVCTVDRTAEVKTTMAIVIDSK